MSIRILQGDCIEVMKTLDANSIDAIVTDPPYGLGFMGKEWDTFTAADVPMRRNPQMDAVNTGASKQGGRQRAGADYQKRQARDMRAFQEWCEQWAAECLRVLKPGGHLLAFSGTRTQHRMVCAIEDAGFEIRDQAAWCYASGFPKSLNLDNERGGSICGCDDSLHGVRSSAHDAGRLGAQGQDAKLQQAMQRDAARGGMEAARPQGAGGVERPEQGGLFGEDERRQQSSLEGRGDDLQEEGQLFGSAVRSSADMGAADGAQRRLPDGASAGDGRVVRVSADADRSGASHRPRPSAKPAVESGAVAGQPKPQAGGTWPVCGGCGLPVLPRGLGTALKPAWEPICVARKPLAKGCTVAANVLKHGTGAINIDGCRVVVEGEVNPSVERRQGAINHLSTRPAAESEAEGKMQSRQSPEAYRAERAGEALGRWPANLLHDGSDEVVALFPQSAGQSGAVTGNEPSSKTNAVYGDFNGRPASIPRLDSGSAARFFWCAKTSSSDRNDGLQGLPEKVVSVWGGDEDDLSVGKKSTKPRANTHPTVKPTELMRYLCRLVTPPGGTVLDPFMGSGSTLKAAELEGFSAIGIELDPAYIEIAKRRIAADAPLFADVQT